MPEWIDPTQYPHLGSRQETYHKLQSPWTIEPVDDQFVFVTTNPPKLVIAICPHPGDANGLVADHNKRVRREDESDRTVDERAALLVELVRETQDGLTSRGILTREFGDPLRTCIAMEVPKEVADAAATKLNESFERGRAEFKRIWESAKEPLGENWHEDGPLEQTFGAFVVDRKDGQAELRVFDILGPRPAQSDSDAE